MTNKNQVTFTPNAFYGYIDDSTPCGRAKANQVKADMETLTTMLNDTNLSTATKKAIYTDYTRAIKEYVEREETCDDCTNEECDYYEEEEEEEEEWEDEEEELTIEDMENFIIVTNGTIVECDTYEDTTYKITLLEVLGFGYYVYAYDSENNEYPCRVIKMNEEIDLEIDN